MGHLAFVAAAAVLPDRLIEDAVVVCRDETITYVGTSKNRIPAKARVVDAGGGWICPGFVDIHVHGGAGADVMDGTLDAVQTVCRAHARHGSTTLFPTTSTGSVDQLDAMLRACGEARQRWSVDAGAKVAGAHLYGPYFAEDKAGCHDRSGCRSPVAAEYRRYFKSGIVKIATCAAELEGAQGFYRTAAKSGMPDHVRSFQRQLVGDARGVRLWDAARRSFLVCDEQRLFGTPTAGRSDAGQHAGVRAGQS